MKYPIPKTSGITKAFKSQRVELVKEFLDDLHAIALAQLGPEINMQPFAGIREKWRKVVDDSAETQ